MQNHISKFLRETSPIEKVEFLSSAKEMTVNITWKGNFKNQFIYDHDILWETLIEALSKLVLGYYAAQIEGYVNSLSKPVIIKSHNGIIVD